MPDLRPQTSDLAGWLRQPVYYARMRRRYSTQLVGTLATSEVKSLGGECEGKLRASPHTSSQPLVAATTDNGPARRADNQVDPEP